MDLVVLVQYLLGLNQLELAFQQVEVFDTKYLSFGVMNWFKLD